MMKKFLDALLLPPTDLRMDPGHGLKVLTAIFVAAIGVGFLALVIWMAYKLIFVQGGSDLFLATILTAFMVCSVLCFVVTLRLFKKGSGRTHKLPPPFSLRLAGWFFLTATLVPAALLIWKGRASLSEASTVFGGVLLSYWCFIAAKQAAHERKLSRD